MAAKKINQKKQIGLLEATLYGVGIILGAGIYALIGAGAGVSGNALWLAFLLGAVIAAFSGFSYAELSSMFPKEAAEFVYTKNAFKANSLAFMVQWIMLAVNIIAAATVALGFAGYFSFLIGGPIIMIAIFLILAMSAINFIGIRESAKFNDFATVIEASGLIGIITFGFYYMARNDVFASVDWLAAPGGVIGILSGTAIVYFAFIGFENLVNISEETKNPQKTIPKALVISLIVSAIIYVLVSFAAIGMLGAQALAESKAPLADVAGKIMPNGSMVLSIIALFATANTVLILLIVASRLLYGLSSNNMLPKALSYIGKRGTPTFAVLLIALLASASLLIGNIKSLAHLVDLGIFVVYIFVNLSVIILRYSQPKTKRNFRMPLNFGKFPVLAAIAIALNCGMLFFFDAKTFFLGLILCLAGAIFYGIGVLCKSHFKY